jgi:TRAP-type C4-dicarboxylate transport system permease small subunit
MIAARRLLDGMLFVLSGLTLTVIVCAVALEVFFRFIVRSSLPWSGELGTMGLVWMSFLAGSYAISKKMNIRIELLVRVLPEQGRAWLEFATNLLLLGLFVTLFVIGMRYTLVIAPSSTGAMVVSQAYFYAAVPVSAVFMGCYTVMALWEERPWRRRSGSQPQGASQ